VKSPAAPAKPRRIITAAQFDRLYQALPDADTKLLVETDIESGWRWGELTKLRVGDLGFETCILAFAVGITSDEEIRRQRSSPGGTAQPGNNQGISPGCSPFTAR
jgi:integrase